MARVRYSGTSPDERVMARVNRVVRGIATVDMKPLEERLVDAARVALRLDRTGSDREVRKRHSLAQPAVTHSAHGLLAAPCACYH